MARFVLNQRGTLYNVLSLQFIKIDPEDNKKVLLYRINGQIVTEEYDTAEEAEEAYNTYKTAMTETEGPSQKELKKKIAELSNIVAEQQGQISDLTVEVEEQNDIIDIATGLSNNILS